MADPQQSQSILDTRLEGQHSKTINRTDLEISNTLLECGPPPTTKPEPATEVDEQSTVPNSQSNLQTSAKQPDYETPMLEEKTWSRNIASNSVSEADILGTGDQVDIATAAKYSPQGRLPPYDGAVEHNAAAQDGPSNEVAEHFIPMSVNHELSDSRLDDDEDVANCLLSPEEIEARARNWTDEDHENPAPLDARSLMKRTGIDKIAIQDLYEELQSTQKQAVFTTSSLEEDEVLLSNNKGSHTKYPRANSSDDHEEVGSSKEPQISASELGDADSDGGAPVNDRDQSLQTPGSIVSSVTSRSTESKEAFPVTAGCAETGHRKPEIGPLSGKSIQQIQTEKPADCTDLYVLKRIQCRSAPGALDLHHDRSISETTLVNSPRLQTATASPPGFHLPSIRPSAPRHVADSEQRLDEAEYALRVEQAIEETKEATNREWESANAATELRHESEIEDLKEDQEAAIVDLQEKHQEDRKRVRRNHGDKMKNLRGEVARARSETTAVEETLVNIKIERKALRDELRAKNDQLERAVMATQTLQANNNIRNYQQTVRVGHIAEMRTHPIKNAQLAELVLGLNKQLEQQAAHFNAVTAQLQDDLTQCQQTRDWYMEKSERYHSALVQNVAETPLLKLEGREEELIQLRSRLCECEAALDDEQRTRAAEGEMFSNQVMSMREGIRRYELDAKAMQLSRNAALAANEAKTRMMGRPMSDNEVDAAFWEQYRIIQKDYQELRQNADGHEQQKAEKEEEINLLKAKVLELGMQGPKDQERIHELVWEVRRLKFDYDTALHELDIAVQDQEKREPELWKSIRDQQLREKDEKIACLEAQLQKEVAEECNSGPKTPSNPGNQWGTPGPLFGNEEATRPENFWTPSHGSCLVSYSDRDQVTQAGVLATPNGSPTSDQADISFF